MDTPKGGIGERTSFPLGVADDGTVFTEDNLPYYIDENGRLVFRRGDDKKSSDAKGAPKGKA